MSWLPGWYSTEHRSYTAGQTLVPSVGSLYSHWTHLGKCIDVATSLQARSSILSDIIQQVPFLSSRHCCVVLTIIIRALYCICIYIQLYMGYDVWHIVSCQTFSWISTGITISAVLPHLWHYIILNTSNMSFLSRLRGKCIQLLTRLIHGPLLNLQRLDISESMWALVILGVTRELEAAWI